MAIDEAILTARIANLSPNTVRFYRWKPSAVSIGKFQDAQKELQLENCRNYSVDLVRRITGGGTVYHGAEGEITYSVVADKKDLGSHDITQVYSRIYSGLVEALKILGITADFGEGNQNACPNLTVRSKKISGSAQAHKSGIVLQHGTLLLSVDLPKMFSLLRVPWARTCTEVVNIAEKKITSVNHELQRETSIEEVNVALVQGFQEALGIKFEEGSLSPYEQELSAKLRKGKYATDEWNLEGKTTSS
jgi:lipoate-protein ligase A